MDGGCQGKFCKEGQRSKDAGLHLEANDSRLCLSNAKTHARRARQAALTHVE
jgi:hypothetical protein